MNRIYIDGRLVDTPKIYGTGENSYGMFKFWHDDGPGKDGTRRQSYRTVFCDPSTAEYLIKRGWSSGDEVIVEGMESIEKNTKNGETFVNVVIRRAQVKCGLKKGDTLDKYVQQEAPAPQATAPQAPQQQARAPQAQAQCPPPGYDEPRSMEELDDFDEEEMELD